MKIFARTTLFTILFLNLTLAWAAMGWIKQEKSGKQILFYNQKVKLVQSSEDAANWTLFNTKNNQITFVSPKNKTYATTTVEDYCKQATAIKKEMEAGLSHAERVYIRHLNLTYKQSTKVAIKPLKNRENIAGLQARKYAILVDNEPYQYVWVAPFAEKTPNSVLKFIKLNKAISLCLAKVHGSQANDPSHTKEYQDLEKKGWWLKSAFADADKEYVDDITIKLGNNSLKASDFLPPKEYRAVTIGELIKYELSLNR